MLQKKAFAGKQLAAKPVQVRSMGHQHSILTAPVGSHGCVDILSWGKIFVAVLLRRQSAATLRAAAGH